MSVFREILHELRELIQTNRENRQAIQQMKAFLSEHQKVIDFVLADHTHRNEQLMKEIRSLLVHQSVLHNPETAELYRQPNTRLISSFPSPVYVENKQFQLIMAENAGFGGSTTNRAWYRSGYLGLVSTSTYQRLNEGFPELTTAQNLSVVSASPDDTAGGTGVRTILFSGLDAITYANILSGLASWRSGTQYTQINEVGYITQWNIGSYNAAVIGELHCSTTGGPNGAMVARAVAYVLNNTFDVAFAVPIRVPNLGTIASYGLAKGPSAEANCSMDVYTLPVG